MDRRECGGSAPDPTLEAEDGRLELRAVTGPDYGRIWDYELVGAVMKIAGDGTGDTC